MIPADSGRRRKDTRTSREASKQKIKIVNIVLQLRPGSRFILRVKLLAVKLFEKIVSHGIES